MRLILALAIVALIGSTASAQLDELIAQRLLGAKEAAALDAIGQAAGSEAQAMAAIKHARDTAGNLSSEEGMEPPALPDEGEKGKIGEIQGSPALSENKPKKEVLTPPPLPEPVAAKMKALEAENVAMPAEAAYERLISFTMPPKPIPQAEDSGLVRVREQPAAAKRIRNLPRDFSVKLAYLAVNGSDGQRERITRQLKDLTYGKQRVEAERIVQTIRKRSFNASAIRDMLKRGENTTEIMRMLGN